MKLLSKSSFATALVVWKIMSNIPRRRHEPQAWRSGELGTYVFCPCYFDLVGNRARAHHVMMEMKVLLSIRRYGPDHYIVLLVDR